MISEKDRDILLTLLNSSKFPKCYSRKNISSRGIEAFVLGEVNYRGQHFLGGKIKGPSRYNKKFPELYNFLIYLMKKYKPKFNFTTIQLNKNVLSKPHVDVNNIGPSYIIAVGDYSGGKLVVEGKKVDIRDKLFKFNGTKGHWVEKFSGLRYSLVFFTHTFKPPHPSMKNIKVKKSGLFKNNKLIKLY